MSQSNKSRRVGTPIGTCVYVRKSSGTVTVGGVDYGAGVTVHGENSQHLVLKIPGNAVWTGTAQTYAPAGFAVFRIDKREERDEQIVYRTTPVVEFPIR